MAPLARQCPEHETPAPQDTDTSLRSGRQHVTSTDSFWAVMPWSYRSSQKVGATPGGGGGKSVFMGRDIRLSLDLNLK